MKEYQYVKNLNELIAAVKALDLDEDTTTALVDGARGLVYESFNAGHKVGYETGRDVFTPVMVDGRPVYL